MKTLTLSKLSEIISEAIQKEIRKPIIEYRLDKISQLTIQEDRICCEDKTNNWILKRQNWEINNYDRFLDIIRKTPADKKGFLTWHGKEEITRKDWIVYTLKNYDVAFALHYIEPGKIDICNLVNNSQLKGIGSYVLQFAKSEGGTQMDNYRGENDNGFLGNLYRKNGFDRQTYQYKFDPQYQSADPEWRLNTDKYGMPDVEGLELSKHRMKYNNPQRAYRKKFDDKIDKKFQ